jgi:transcriptional regulator with XRE-family HTH domain
MSQTKRDTPLRRTRRARTLTQQQFADLLGISQETLSRAERGHPISRDLQELAATILGVPRQELFPESEQVQA